MQLRFALFLGLLLTTSVVSQTSTDASTSVEPTTTAAGSTVTPDPSATTVPSGSSTSASADSSTTQSSGGSTAAPGASTVAPTAGTTGIPASTTLPPLPNVTVSVLQFNNAVCDSSMCTYTFNAPGNDQAFLATESSLISADRSQYGSMQQTANGKDTNIKQANDAARQKIADLQALLNNIQTKLNAIQANIQIIKNNQIDAQATLQFVEKFVSDVNAAPGSCLYQSCLKPTTPAPPTTTPTPSPTTPPSPCLNFDCPDDTATLMHCQLDSINKPFCTNCLNNFDGYGHCNTVACNAAGSGFVFSGTNNGTLFSTGYNQEEPSNSTIPANADCRWQLNGTGTYAIDTNGVLNLTCLASGQVTMFLSDSSGFSQQLQSTFTARTMNSALGKTKSNPIFTLRSTGTESTYCSIPLTFTAATTAPAEFMALPEKKQNGFFSWLMGY